MIPLRLALALCFCCGPVQALHAEPAGKLVIIMGAERAQGPLLEAVSRLKGELAAAGLGVKLVPAAPGNFDFRVALQQAAKQAGGVAAIGIDATVEGPGELWVHDGSIGRTVVQTLRRPGESSADTASVVAVRSVEFVRANLASLSISAEVPMPTQVVPAAHQTMPEFHHGWSLGLGVNYVDGLGGVAPAAMGVLSLAWATRGAWAFEVRASGLGRASAQQGDRGTALVQHTLLTPLVAYRWPLGSRLELAAIAGMGAYRGSIEGTTAGSPYASRSMATWAATGQAGGAAWLWLHRHACVRLDVAALATLPALIVRLGDERIGRVAAPALLASLSAWAAF